ncbi:MULTISPECIES: hypothetical protein [Mycolicibacterium]|uniref:hypothetical protein n=1 Tax=Mycolicibacterium monacense TaxID=85693 RepID=UPI0007E96BE2|nr:hypothetical protein [Mycolicibacterium monacense]OBB55537.1 hypothetical protein A6B34_07630 [Mycolicibacterium monacense]
MTRHYSPHSPYTSARTERLDRPRADQPGYDDRPSYAPYSGADHPGYRHYADGQSDYGQSWASGRYAAADVEDPDYEDYEDYEDYDAYAAAIDSRWKWIAGVAGAVLLVAVICTLVILGGGDSGSVSATVGTSAQSRPPATATAPHDTSAALPPPTASLAPETITTVTPTAPPSPSASTTPDPAPSAVAPPPPAAATPRAITYTVTGNRQLIDFVTVIYTDQQGALQTEVNVSLPWSKTVVLDPGVELKSVTATSVGGQLNCAITDAAGAALVTQNNNSMITTCTQ